MLKFEKLDVWQRAIEFSFQIHELTRNFPKEEQYILTAQIKRAADSVALNIAEGSTGQTNAEFRQFMVTQFGLPLRLSHVCSWARGEGLFEKLIFRNCT